MSRQWLDDDGSFLFGKHQGDSLEDVAADDPSYFDWILSNVEDIDEEDRDAIMAMSAHTGRSRSKGWR